MRDFSHYTFNMDYDFSINSEGPRIPPSAYQPVKRCPVCKSVFITEKLCESCGRSLIYHPIGEAFGPKSFYGIKHRYIENLQPLIRLFPVFEDRTSKSAESYKRNLSKRFTDLIEAFNSSEESVINDRKFFYTESIELINELLRYGVSPVLIRSVLENNDSSLVGRELLLYLQNAMIDVEVSKKWYQEFLDFKIGGVLRTDFALKVFLIMATIVIVAINFKEFISSQVGK